MIDVFATLGPACSDEKILREMFREGMSGIRLNLSHMSLAEHTEEIKMIQRAAAEENIAPKILIDLQGPELRLGDLKENITVETGEIIYFKKKVGKYKSPKVRMIGSKEEEMPEDTDASEGKTIFVERKIIEMISPKQDILIDDGKILVRAEKCSEGCVSAEVIRGGVISSRKSIKPIGSEDALPTLTANDITNISHAKEAGVTGVMQPFVRGKEDIMNVRKALEEAGAGDIRIYAKIENEKGVEKLSEIIEASDEIVIARGDLGNSVPLWELPALQKKISAACREAGKPFMVVTQMLASMEHSPVPTRAEVSDIYNAVLDGASSVMVTGETAVGEYPAEVILYMAKTAKTVAL